jgi:hypothetical protein
LTMQWSLPTLDLGSSIAIQFVFNATVTRLTLVKVGLPITLSTYSILMGKAMRYSSTVLVNIWYCILLVPVAIKANFLLR